MTERRFLGGARRFNARRIALKHTRRSRAQVVPLKDEKIFCCRRERREGEGDRRLFLDRVLITCASHVRALNTRDVLSRLGSRKRSHAKDRVSRESQPFLSLSLVLFVALCRAREKSRGKKRARTRRVKARAEGEVRHRGRIV